MHDVRFELFDVFQLVVLALGIGHWPFITSHQPVGDQYYVRVKVTTAVTDTTRMAKQSIEHGDATLNACDILSTSIGFFFQKASLAAEMLRLQCCYCSRAPPHVVL